MGQVPAILKALSCDSCAKYVLNDCRCHSSCLEGCCDFEFETQATELSRDQDIEIEVIGCCGARKGD
jgi:hypothetical protein